MAFQDFDQISERRRAERRRKLKRQIAIVAASSIVLVIIVAAAVVVVVTKDQEDDDDGPNTTNNLNSVETKPESPPTNPATDVEDKHKTEELEANPKTPPTKEPEASPKTLPTKEPPGANTKTPPTKEPEANENGGEKEKNDNKGDEKDTNDEEGKDKKNVAEENKFNTKIPPANPATKDSSSNKNGGVKENNENKSHVKDTNDKEGKDNDNDNASEEGKDNSKNSLGNPTTTDSSSKKNSGERENEDNIQATKKNKANDIASEDKKGKEESNDSNEATKKSKANESEKGEKENNDNSQTTKKNKANDIASEDRKDKKESNDNNEAAKKSKANDNGSENKRGEKKNDDHSQTTKKNNIASEDRKGKNESNDNNEAIKKSKANDNTSENKKGEKENNDNSQATKKKKANDKAREENENENDNNNQAGKKDKANDKANEDKKGDDKDDGNNSSGNNKSTNVKTTHKKLAHHSRFVKAMCKNTDYQNRCQESLDKATKKNSSSVQPKDLLKAGIAAVKDEIKKAFHKTKHFKFKSEKDKAAFEDCEELLNDAIDELQDAAYEVGNSTDAKKVSAKVPELNNWLSAVMSYQQTCIDGFEDGSKLKTKIKDAYSGSNELTSNSLALVSDFGSVLAELFSIYEALGIHDDDGGNHDKDKNSVGNRHLLGMEAASNSLRDTNGLPSWTNQDQKRMLKGKRIKKKLVPNVTVAKDGSGDFKTIRQALLKMPLYYRGRYIIYVKKGVYVENVSIKKRMVNVTMYGDGSRKSIISGSKNFADGVHTYRTATFAVMGDGFMAKSMGFRNTAGPGKLQAVAARVQADRSVFLNCRFDGFQDTLYVQTHRQFYRSCVVTGTIDFIFGDAAAIFQNCDILLRKPLEGQQNTVTAHGRVDRHETTGIVLQACRIRAAKSLKPVKKKFKCYLGRPWRDYARTVVMESVIDDVIEPEGWVGWIGEEHRNSKVYYAEYNNRGGGARMEKRVSWQGYHKKISRDEASKFTVDSFLQTEWVMATGAPVRTGFFK